MERQIKAVALTLLLLTSNVSLAAEQWKCEDNVQVVKKGDTINCDGFLFGKNAEKDAEQDRADAKYYKSLSDKLQTKSDLEATENGILEQRLKLYMDSSQSLSKDLAQRDNSSTIHNIIWFGLGVVVTGLAVRNLRP